MTNSVLINEDELLVSLQKDEWCKIVILNLDTQTEKVIIEPENAVYCLDMAKVPQIDGMPPYFIMHTGKGLTLVNAEKRKTYDLAQNNQTNFNVCRSI